LGAVYGTSPGDYTELAWRLGSSRLTQNVRRMIQFFSPSYFQADDDCLDLISECRRRGDAVEELSYFRHSYLRRGVWRYLGIGLCDHRLLKTFDRVAKSSATQPSRAPMPRGRWLENQSSPQS